MPMTFGLSQFLGQSKLGPFPVGVLGVLTAGLHGGDVVTLLRNRRFTDRIWAATYAQQLEISREAVEARQEFIRESEEVLQSLENLADEAPRETRWHPALAVAAGFD